MLNLKSVQLSLNDFPGKVAAVVFFGGCNMRCGFCHNPSLVFNKGNNISEKDVLDFLDERRGFIQGVCLTGGEPLLSDADELGVFVEKIKSRGLAVKLDTNGTFPEKLSKVIGLFDYVAMDVKTSLNRYSELGFDDSLAIQKSIELVKALENYEFRTTVAPEVITKDDIYEIAGLVAGSKRFVLQNFVDTVTLDSSFKGKTSKDLTEYAKSIFDVEEFVVR